MSHRNRRGNIYISIINLRTYLFKITFICNRLINKKLVKSACFTY